MNKPVVLCDLDDTLFQTKRKMLTETLQTPVEVGAYDRELQPRSFMSQEQSMLVSWLLLSRLRLRHRNARPDELHHQATRQ